MVGLDIGGYGLPEVDYGEIIFEEFGDVGAIREVITHRKGFWLWMRPQRYHRDAIL